jgi:hypothetical protein
MIADAIEADDQISLDEARQIIRSLFLNESDPAVLPTIFQLVQKLEDMT